MTRRTLREHCFKMLFCTDFYPPEEAGEQIEDYVLSGSEKVVEPRTMQYRYKKLLEAAAVESSNFHQLRHTFATNCVENGYDAKTLSIVLGHSTIALTLDRYVHPNRQYERRMMNSLAVRM